MKRKRRLSIIKLLFVMLLLIFTGCASKELEGRETEDIFSIEQLQGKTVSILGDSISTFEGISNGTAAQTSNSTIGEGSAHYGEKTDGTPLRGDVLLKDTWWYQTAEELGLRILVNNSWNGTCIYEARFGSEGAYVDRCVQLHDDTGENAGEEPELIFIMMGTNDFTNFPETLDQASEVYESMLRKMKARYPMAEIYCLSLLPRREENSLGTGQPTEFNQKLQDVVKDEGCVWVDLTTSDITPENEVFDRYFHESNLHPNAAGMDVITRCLVDAILRSKKQ